MIFFQIEKNVSNLHNKIVLSKYENEFNSKFLTSILGNISLWL